MAEIAAIHLFPGKATFVGMPLMESEPDKSTFFADLKDLVVDYVQTRLELARLTAFEKIAQIIAYLVLGIVLALLFFFGFLFLSIVAGLYLSELLGSMLAGFGCIAVLYFAGFFALARSKSNFLTRRITDAIIRILYAGHEQEDDDAKED